MANGDGCIINIAGDRVAIEPGQPLRLRTTRGWRFDLDVPARYVHPDGTTTEVGSADRLAHLIDPEGRVIESAAAFLDGRLELTFTGGGVLGVAPALATEPWTAVGPRGTRIVSLAGGALTLSH